MPFSGSVLLGFRQPFVFQQMRQYLSFIPYDTLPKSLAGKTKNSVVSRASSPIFLHRGLVHPPRLLSRRQIEQFGGIFPHDVLALLFRDMGRVVGQ